MAFNTDNYLKALKRFELKSLFVDECDPYWEHVAFEVGSCRSKVILDDQPQNPFCILGVLEINTFIQMIWRGTNEWRLELRITQENGNYTHYYGTQDGTGDSDTISDIGLIIEAFNAFYDGDHHPKNVTWIVDDI